MTISVDVLVIGGGLHGLSAALQISRRGASVLLLERNYLGRHASGATAAGVRTLGRNPAELHLALEAAKIWSDMTTFVGDNCGFHAYGQLQVAEDETALEKIALRVQYLEGQGFFHECMLTPKQVNELVPGLGSHCRGGALAAADGAADPHRTIRAFCNAAIHAGVDIRQGCAVIGLCQKNGLWEVETNTELVVDAEMVINAAGAWAGQVAALAGEHLTHTIRTSMMVVTERTRHRIAPVISSYGQKLSFKQTAEGTLLIGGGAQGLLDATRNSASVDAAALSEPARTAERLFPWTKNLRVVRTWAGMEAMTVDSLPVIGHSLQNNGLIHVFGFSGHGFQLVPAVGSALADIVTSGTCRHDLAAFSPSRVMTSGAAA